MFLFLYNNALSFSNSECTKIIYSASNIKKYSHNSLASEYLSTCKYYAHNALQVYKYVFEKKIVCPCIDLKKAKLDIFLVKAKNSINIDDCKQFSEKSLTKLNLIVDEIVSCKIKNN